MVIFILFIAQAMFRGLTLNADVVLKKADGRVGKIFENTLYFLGSYFILIEKKILEFLPKVTLSSNT